MRRIAERVASELDGVVGVAMVDVTTNRELLTRFSEPKLVTGYPTLLLFRRARPAQRARSRVHGTKGFARLSARLATPALRACATARRNGAVYKYEGPRTQEKLTNFALEVRRALLHAAPRLAHARTDACDSPHFQNYVLSKQHPVPPPPTEFKRLVTRVVTRVSGWAERTGIALVVRAQQRTHLRPCACACADVSPR